MGEAESTDVRVSAYAVLVGCVCLTIACLYASADIVGAVQVRECVPVVVVVDVASVRELDDGLAFVGGGHVAYRRKVLD